MPEDTADRPAPRTLSRRDGASIAYHKLDAAPAFRGRAGVVFLHGLMSDMEGGKALHLEDHCRRAGRAFVRFDQYGHGLSSGRFVDGGIGRWTEDTLAILDEVAEGPQVLVGSSMGGWLMLKAALARPDRVAGLVGIAAAPDFTEDLMWPSFTDAQKADLQSRGYIEEPSEYSDEPYVIGRTLIEDGREQLVLRGESLAVRCPIRLIHGQQDASVPWRTALTIQDKAESADVEVILVKAGDHRLSTDADLARLTRTVDALLEAVDP